MILWLLIFGARPQDPAAGAPDRSCAGRHRNALIHFCGAPSKVALSDAEQK